MLNEDIRADSRNDVQDEHEGDALKRVAGIVPRGFWAPKAGNAAADYEDAYALGDDCVALADGATESSFARAWAQSLVAGFVAEPAAFLSPSTQRLQAWLQPLQQTWHTGVAWEKLPWFAEDKARSGAFATLLTFQVLPPKETQETRENDEIHAEDLQNNLQETAGKQSEDPPVPNPIKDQISEAKPAEGSGGSALTATPTSLGMESPLAKSFLGMAQSLLGDNLLLDVAPTPFQVCAIGDSCLFQLRDDLLELAFPLTHSSQFDSRPVLLSSNAANNKQVWEAVALERGTYLPGDILVFATDALAKWFLAQSEAGERPWETLCAISTQAEFELLVQELRHTHAMRNDDVTLVVISDAFAELNGEPLSEPTGMTIEEAL